MRVSVWLGESCNYPPVWLVDRIEAIAVDVDSLISSRKENVVIYHVPELAGKSTLHGSAQVSATLLCVGFGQVDGKVFGQ